MADGVFNPGTGTLKSTDLVNAFCELAMIVQTQERVALTEQATLTANNLTVPDNIAITANFNNDTMTIAIPALPIEITFNAGKIELVAVDYLEPLNAVEPTILNTMAVTGSDLTSTSMVKALLELAQLIQEDEAIAGVNIMSVAFNGDTNTANISATFNGVPQVNANGRIEFVCNNYLDTTP